ncbi:MAG: hypothetical protein QJR03_04880 [Sphaerobacter sp.]|nr:hypothetical protein [Sphaerobacter sp.]
MANMGRTIEVVPESYSYVFSPYREPVARVRPGDRVVIYCDDASGSRIRAKDDLPSKALAGVPSPAPRWSPRSRRSTCGGGGSGS